MCLPEILLLKRREKLSFGSTEEILSEDQQESKLGKSLIEKNWIGNIYSLEMIISNQLLLRKSISATIQIIYWMKISFLWR